MNIQYRRKDYINLFSNTVFGINFTNWMRLLARNKFSIPPAFWLKAIFITVNSLFFAPVYFLERLLYRNRINNTKVVKPIFILGHHRSGTTYLHNLLSRDPNLAFCSTYQALVPNQFLLGGGIFRRILGKFMPATRPQDNVKSGAEMPIEEEFAMGNMCGVSFTHSYYFPQSIRQVFDSVVTFETATPALMDEWKTTFDYLLKKLSFKNSGKRLVLKSPSNTGRMKELLSLYPDAVFIHIHRDPNVVYLSNVNLYEKILPILSFQKADNKDIDDFIFYSYRKIHEKFLADKKSTPVSKLVEISFNDLVADPMEQLERIYRHLGIDGFGQAAPHFTEEIKDAAGYKTNSYKSPDAATKKRIAEEWGFMFDAYGYPKG